MVDEKVCLWSAGIHEKGEWVWIVEHGARVDGVGANQGIWMSSYWRVRRVQRGFTRKGRLTILIGSLRTSKGYHCHESQDERLLMEIERECIEQLGWTVTYRGCSCGRRSNTS